MDANETVGGDSDVTTPLPPRGAEGVGCILTPTLDNKGLWTESCHLCGLVFEMAFSNV